MLAPEGPGLVGASSVGPFAVKQRSLADPDGQFIFFAEGDIRRDVHVEGQEDAEVATGGPAIDEDLRVSRYGFEMEVDLFSLPAGGYGKGFAEPAHFYVLPRRGVPGVAAEVAALAVLIGEAVYVPGGRDADRCFIPTVGRRPRKIGGGVYAFLKTGRQADGLKLPGTVEADVFAVGTLGGFHPIEGGREGRSKLQVGCRAERRVRPGGGGCCSRGRGPEAPFPVGPGAHFQFQGAAGGELVMSEPGCIEGN